MVKTMIWTIAFCAMGSGALRAQGHTLFEMMAPKQTGIQFVNDIEENDGLNVLAYEYFYNGGGVAVGDINNDGLADLYFTANLKPDRLYLNKGGFRFEDITNKAGLLGAKGWKTGVTMADVNGDGWLDIYVCHSGKGDAQLRRNTLYINNGNLTFTERAKEMGLGDAGCSTQAAFFDYDRDGDLDCYVLNHNIKAYKNIELHHLKTEYDSLAADRLYRNENGHFTDVSGAAGISGNPISFGLGIAISDINNDGWPDIYVSNDYTEQDYCYINNRNGTFTAREHYMFTHLSQFSMGSDIADINNDGWVDIFTLDMLPEGNRRQKLLQAQENYELYQGMAENGFHYQFMRNMLHLNNGNGTFSEVGQLAGISNTDWSWAPLWADFDNDGHKDLYVTNGYMRDYTNKDFLKFWGDYLVKQAVNRDSVRYLDIIKLMPVTLLKNYAFCNKGNLRFDNVGASWGLDQAVLSNGAAYADLDNDGDLDLVVNNINAPAGVYRNNLPPGAANSIAVTLQGQGMNTQGIGARLWCFANGQVQLLEQMPTRGYQSCVTDILHVGLGKATQADSLWIQWPNGLVQRMDKVQAGQRIVVKQGTGTAGAMPRLQQPTQKLFSPAPLLEWAHLQLEYNDFKRQPLMPVMLSPTGPKMAVADLNKDGLEDLFIGGSQGQGSELYLQQSDGQLQRQTVPAFMADSLSVTTGIAIFDADGNGLPDIYCASGGYNDFVPGDERLQDRLFLNNGKGLFVLATASLPPHHASKAAVAVADVDGDGDLDIFTGGSTVPGSYPETEQPALLINDGKGVFANMAQQWLAGIALPGRVTDACWADVDNDNKSELLIAGEWMPLTILRNTGSKLEPVDKGLGNTHGWWNNLALADMDNDGDLDIMAGNWGLNSQIKASATEPASITWLDVDKNGSIDPFLCFYIGGISYPYVSRDELLDQVYPFRKKFTSYNSYADATLQNILTAEELAAAQTLRANTLETSFFENKGGRFEKKELPREAQFAPVYKILPYDFNHDGLMDMLLLGNNDYARLKIGKLDANFGTLLLNTGANGFRYAGYAQSGLAIAGNVKDAQIIRTVRGRYLLVGINNSDCITYKLNE